MFYLHFYFIYLLGLHCVPCDLIFLTQGLNLGPSIGSVESQLTDNQEIPLFELFFFKKKIFVSVLNSL